MTLYSNFFYNTRQCDFKSTDNAALVSVEEYAIVKERKQLEQFAAETLVMMEVFVGQRLRSGLTGPPMNVFARSTYRSFENNIL